MSNFKKTLILLFAVFLLVMGIVTLNHSHSDGALQNKNKGQCSVCVFISAIYNAILIILSLLVTFSAVAEQIIKQVFAIIRKCFFLPPSLAPPVLV